MAKRPKQDSLKPNASSDDVAKCLAAVLEVESDMARLKQKVGTIYKNFEAMGVDRKAIKFTIRMMGTQDAELQHKINTQYLVIAGLVDVDEEGQGTFIRAMETEKPKGDASQGLAAARAHGDGYNSGKLGARQDGNRFDAGSLEHVKWDEGWRDGNADRLERNPNADKVKASKPEGRRGRKRRGASDDIGETAGSA